MKVRLINGVNHPACWAGFRKPLYPAGMIVPVIPAHNLPNYREEGLLWIQTPELKHDPYGILLRTEDYEAVEEEGKS